MYFRKFQPWARQALVRALQQPNVLNGVGRCIQEERALIVQMVRRKTTGRVAIVQYPVASIAEAYDKLRCDDMQASEFVSYFIVASMPALAEAARDGIQVMRTLRPEGHGHRQAEILRTPYTVQFSQGKGVMALRAQVRREADHA